MKSLLYKDYVATNGPIVIGGFGLLTVFICVFAVYSTVNIGAEVLLGLWTPMVFMGGCIYLLMLMSQLFQADSGKNCRDYLLTMPVDKKEYLLSKYIYYLVANYLVLSWGIFLSMIAATAVKTEGMMMMVSTIQLMGPIVIPVMLIMAAITFPLLWIPLWHHQKTFHRSPLNGKIRYNPYIVLLLQCIAASWVSFLP